MTEFTVHKTIPLADLPGRGPDLADEVGGFLAWAWPLFEASRTGRWPRGYGGDADVDTITRPRADGDGVVELEVDESAPATIDDLADRTALPPDLLREMESALLTRRQIVLTGPPGTSKTFVARQFARYFARASSPAAAGPARPQGVTHTLYMHAGWAYEDFFEGLRPVDRGGHLAFENRPGLFLRWVADELRGQPAAARHVLVLDELNRCDTAAVLGELLQLLEYRGETVPLRSGRPFAFPPNLYVVGTMNAADRSVGRIDLALRRRFFWLDLHPRPDALARWLARPGNNPAAFDAAALQACNDLLAAHGVGPDQQVGHALFMGRGEDASRSPEDAGGDRTDDLPLTPDRLRQVVRFSVLPYVRELMSAHTGSPRTADEIAAQVEAHLLPSHPGAHGAGTGWANGVTAG